MSRILIMEDDETDREDLVQRMRAEMPDAHIDASGFVEEGTELIRIAARRGKPYHAAILDFMLNSVIPVLHHVPNESLCQSIQRTMPECLVIHVTGHSGDDIVAQHIHRHHEGYRSPRYSVFPKKQRWVKESCSRVRQYLTGKQVHDLLDALFTASAVYPGTGLSAIHNGEFSGTHVLASLQRQLARDWTSLEEETKERVSIYFDVSVSNGDVKMAFRRAGGKGAAL